MTGNGFGIDMDALRDGVRAMRGSLAVMEGHTMTDLTALQDIAATDQLDTAVRGIGTDVPQGVIWRNLHSHDNSINGMQASSGGDTGVQAIDLLIEDSVSEHNGRDGLSIGTSGATAVTGLVTLRRTQIAGNARYQISTDKASGVVIDQDGAIPVSVVRP